MCIKGIQLSSLSVLATLTQSSPSLGQDPLGHNPIVCREFQCMELTPTLSGKPKANPQPSPRGSAGRLLPVFSGEKVQQEAIPH